MHKKLRTRLLFDKLQHRLLITNLIYFVTFGFATGVAVFAPLLTELSAPPSLSVDQQRAAETFEHLAGLLLPAGVVLVVLLTFHSMIITHRVAGPLFRFREGLQAASGGDLSPLRIRKHDYLHRELSAINSMFAAVNEKNDSVRERLSDLQHALSQLAADAAGSEFETSLSDLQEKLDAIQSAIAELGSNRSCETNRTPTGVSNSTTSVATPA